MRCLWVFLTSWSWKRKIKKIFGKEILWEDQPCQVIVEFLIVRQKCRTWEVNKDIWHEDDFKSWYVYVIKLNLIYHKEDSSFFMKSYCIT